VVVVATAIVATATDLLVARGGDHLLVVHGFHLLLLHIHDDDMSLCELIIEMN
jgi:hypothetical protein